MNPTKNLPAMTGEVMTGANGRAANNRALQPKYTTAQPRTQAPTSDRQSMLAQALRYAVDLGWPVLPVRGKDPATDHGHKLSLIHLSEPTRQAEISYDVF